MAMVVQTWHQDGEYVRLTFAIDDIDPIMGGGTGFMPGTHRKAALAGPAVPLEPWANMESDAGIEVGANLEGAMQMFGKAGCCAVNYTTIWHRRMANRGEQTIETYAMLQPTCLGAEVRAAEMLGC